MKIKDKILCEGFNKEGQSVIAMWSNPMMIYGRTNGSWFIVDRRKNKRIDVQRRDDGSFYLATHPKH